VFFLEKIEWQDSDLLLVFSGDHGERQIVCRSVELLHLENRLSCHSFDIDAMPSPVQDHTLLWEWTECGCDLYFAAAPPDPHAVIGRLAAVHDTLAGEWFPFNTWLAQRRLQSQADLLRLGSGLFGYGPKPVMQAYRDVLDVHGCRPSLLRSGHGADMTDQEVRSCSNMSALIFSPQFYVLATSFEESAT
jgi:hypothetical protein